MSKRRWRLQPHDILLVAACWGCHSPEPGPCEASVPLTAPTSGGHNVVVILIDDLGVERFSQYPDATVPLALPTFEALGSQSVRFDAAYSDTTCSPTRASLLTGRRPRRHGIGRFVDSRDPDQEGLSDDAVTIAEMLRESPLGPWSTAITGKWHLDQLADADAAFGPLDQGFDTFRGTLGNPNAAVTLRPKSELGYSRWEYDVDGVLSENTSYLTTVTTDDAIEQVRTLSEPFFLYVPYNAAHAPFHIPPPELLPNAVPTDATDAELQDAMLQVLDRELARLVSEIDLTDTLLIVTSDNGTPAESQHEPGGGHKSSVREGGVHVPMWVAGAGVEGPGSSDALVYVADVFATVADVAGVDLRDWTEILDGRSLLPHLSGEGAPRRTCLVAEQFPKNGKPGRGLDLSIRDDAHLLIDKAGDRKEYRDLGRDRVGEPSELPKDTWTEADEAAFERLTRWLREDQRAVR